MAKASKLRLSWRVLLACTIALAMSVLILRSVSPAAAQESNNVQSAPTAPDQPARHDWSQDLPMKIKEPFTLAAVGDLIMKRPSGNYDDPRFQAAIKIVHDADMSFANFESNIIDERHYNGPLAGFNGPPEVGPDVKAMGFKMVNRAANHVLDSDKEGFFATNDALSEAGLVYAGAGRNLDEARAAQYLDMSKGRVGLVGMHTMEDNLGGSYPQGVRDALAATHRVGQTGGAAGVSVIGLTKTVLVSEDQLAALKKVRDAIYDRRTGYTNYVESPSPSFGDLVKDGPDRVTLFGIHYKVGKEPGDNTYEMNSKDLDEVMRAIRAGKEYSDFMMAAIHTHQNSTDLQMPHFSDHPPDFLVALAHKAIDNGADAFLGSGPHVLRGVEIYKGKPIFYGLAEFFNDMDTMPPGDPAQEVAIVGRYSVLNPINYESAIALSRYDKGKLQEVRLYPIEQGWAGPISRRGTPLIASGETAQRILQRIQKLSEPFGTKIEIEGSVGVIHVTQ